MPRAADRGGMSWKVYSTPDAHLGHNVLRYFPRTVPVGDDPTLSADAFGSRVPADSPPTP